VLPLVVRSCTRDGVDVVALADLTVDRTTVEAGTAYLPTARTARIAEETLAAGVEGLDVTALLDDLEQLTSRWQTEISARLPAGLGVADLTLIEVEAQLTPRVADAIVGREQDDA
jgi:hypothetical protein